jgi:uncharacterized protein YndB with AHSA1/START domain
MAGIVAMAETEIDATPDVVWRTLTDPAAIKQFMFGAAVETDWQPGSPIVWRGEYQGKAYEDKGEVIAVTPGRRLELTHFSPLSGQADIPENYHTLIYTLKASDTHTRLSLSQDNNADQAAADHAQANWEQMLAGVKQLIEARRPRT